LGASFTNKAYEKVNILSKNSILGISKNSFGIKERNSWFIHF
jgi:hypothetical protein